MGALLDFICTQAVFVINHSVVRWTDCALEASMGLEVEIKAISKEPPVRMYSMKNDEE